MAARATAQDLFPEPPSYDELVAAAARCEACPLYRNATQTVFGEGAAGAAVMLVGEQPGDQEDLAGPAVRRARGPAARPGAGEGRDRPRPAYVTNVVKHFKSGRRAASAGSTEAVRAREVQACRPWLDGELRLVRPEVLVLLGRDRRPGAARRARSASPASAAVFLAPTSPRR